MGNSPSGPAGRDKKWPLTCYFVAHPASFNTNLAPVIEGPIISLAPKHAKVRREGYRR
jgi:hypothetical protein